MRVLPAVLRLIVAFVLIGGMAGCAMVETVPAAPPVQQVNIDSFQISGRISVRYGSDGFSGNLTWRHAHANDEFVILTPLGQGVARIQKNAAGVRLETSDQQVFHAQDAESLTEQTLGFRLPLSGLSSWVQARAVTPEATLRHNADGTVDTLSEQGWKIDYLSYQPIGPLQLPGKVFMESNDLKLRLIVDAWQVPAP